jgi:spermidine synthase
MDRMLLRRGYLFFFVSGLAALLYEVVWGRLLGLVFGNTTYAVATVLGAFMGGLGLGGFFGGKLADRCRNPLRL